MKKIVMLGLVGFAFAANCAEDVDSVVADDGECVCNPFEGAYAGIGFGGSFSKDKLSKDKLGVSSGDVESKINKPMGVLELGYGKSVSKNCVISFAVSGDFTGSKNTHIVDQMSDGFSVRSTNGKEGADLRKTVLSGFKGDVGVDLKHDGFSFGPRVKMDYLVNPKTAVGLFTGVNFSRVKLDRYGKYTYDLRTGTSAAMDYEAVNRQDPTAGEVDMAFSTKNSKVAPVIGLSAERVISGSFRVRGEVSYVFDANKKFTIGMIDEKFNGTDLSQLEAKLKRGGAFQFRVIAVKGFGS